MNKKALDNPSSQHRVLKIDHHLCGDLDYAKKRLIDLKDRGYGGVVTNVAFTDYLVSQEKMDIFQEIVRFAKEEGLRVWIYDEQGYPSGTAGGLTLTANKDYEAKGLCGIIKKVNRGEEVVIERTKSHDFLLSYSLSIHEGIKEVDNSELYSKPEDLYVDSLTGNITYLDEYIDDNYTLRYTPTETSLVCYYQTKRLYEGTHAQHNVSASRRYISVISKEAIKEFINNTYEKYTKTVGDLYGNTIEAFFTDEPSFMTGYLNKGLYPRTVDDPYDDSIPLLPVVSWDTFVREEFISKFNYDIYENLHYLFAGTNAKAQQVREDYLSLMSDLYNEAFFKQLGEYCEEYNIHFSGHTLLEENILHHAIYEGNLFRLIGNMGIPGIDMLTTIPDEIVDSAATPKLISSSAKWHNRKQVMTETSGHNQSARNISYGFKEMIASLATQFALGVDVFTSYYSDTSISDEENREFNTFAARLGEMFNGGSSNISTAVYYPIESAWIATKGSDKQLYEREYSLGAINLENSWQGIIKELLRNQIEFDCLDADAIIDGTKEGVLTSPSKETYRTLVIPRVLRMPQRLYDTLLNLAKTGTSIIFHSCSDLVKDNIEALTRYENVRVIESLEEIAKLVNDNSINDWQINSDRSIIIKSANQVKLGFKKVILMVNTSQDQSKAQVRIENADSLALYDPHLNSFTKFNDTNVDVSIEGYKCKIICID